MAIEQTAAGAQTGHGEGADSARYAFLHGRARQFLLESGGAAHEEALIRHVFGSGGSSALWRPLLRQLLAGPDAFELRADGYWCLPGFAPPRPTRSCCRASPTSCSTWRRPG